MANVIKLELILTGVAGVLVLIVMVVMPIDIIDFYENKETYAMVYQLNTQNENWELEYLSRWIYIGAPAVVGLIIMTLRIILKNNEMIRKMNWIFLFVLFASMIIGFFNWMKAGFDH